MNTASLETEPTYDFGALEALEAEVRGRLETPPPGAPEVTLVCIDARAGHPECSVLGIDHQRHVARHAGALHGVCTDLNIAYATSDPYRYATHAGQSHEINKSVAETLLGEGLISTVHEECADMHATPETVGAMALFDEVTFELAKDILEGNLDRAEYARVVMGSNIVAQSRIDHPDTVMSHFRSNHIPVAKLRNTGARRAALIVNRTDKLLPPMEFNSNGDPLHTLVYDADPELVVPKLTAVGQELLTPKINRRTLDVVTATHLAVLANRKLQLPVLVLN